MKFEAGSNKGGVKQGDLFNDVFALGAMGDERINYSGAAVTEAFDTGAKFTAAWTPVVAKAFYVKDSKEVSPMEEGGTWYTYKVVTSAGVVSYTNEEPTTSEAGKKVAYKYDNVTIPQNDIPQVTARMAGIELAAKARRLAIYYSQMAAFQARTELGIDLGEILATQACAELAYEIDTEIVKLLADSAKVHPDLTWSKTLPIGVNKRD